MKIKVCGMRDPGNIAALGAHRPDYIGLIFYEKSPRFVGDLPAGALDTLPEEIRRVGVFVNAEGDYIREKARQYRLDLVQLHGDETPEFCADIRKDHPVIKAFGIAAPEDLFPALSYEGSCDYFLFDAKTPARGGAGIKFDHSVLELYAGQLPYFLSGGIGPDDTEHLFTLGDSRCVAIDVNSRFETAPGMKDVPAAGNFIRQIRNPKKSTP